MLVCYLFVLACLSLSCSAAAAADTNAKTDFSSAYSAAAKDSDVCWCDDCAEAFRDQCKDTCSWKSSLFEAVQERTDLEMKTSELSCKSCMVNCMSDDLSINVTSKQMRCRDERLQWKRMQLCNARRKKTPIFFKHIHKAGGVMFCNKIAKLNVQCPRNPNCIAGGKNFCGLRNMSLKQQRGLVEKFSELEFFSSESALPTRWAWGAFTWVTMLRRPEDRALSAFYWWLQHLNDRDERFVMEDGILMKKDNCENYKAPFPNVAKALNGTLAMHLGTWLEHYPDNHMVRNICGEGTFEVPKGHLTQAHLICAKRRLNLFGLVLVLERLEESVEALRLVLNWKHADIDRKGSVANARQDSGKPTSAFDELGDSPELINTLVKMHHLDNELYNYANELLQAVLDKFR